MENLSSLQKDLKQLSAKYKKNDAYIKFGQSQVDDFSVSSFWNADLGFVDKYKNLDLKNIDTK